MSDASFVETILLNMGEWTPALVIVWMFVWKMWPGVLELMKSYLQARTSAAPHSFVPQTVTIVLDPSVRDVVTQLAAFASVARPTADVSPPRAADAVMSPGGASTGTQSGGGAARSSDAGTGGPS